MIASPSLRADPRYRGKAMHAASHLMGLAMALVEKKEVFRGRLIRINQGLSDKTDKSLVQISLFNGATKEMKGIFIGAARREELALELEAAARALRNPLGTPAPETEMPPELIEDDFE